MNKRLVNMQLTKNDAIFNDIKLMLTCVENSCSVNDVFSTPKFTFWLKKSLTWCKSINDSTMLPLVWVMAEHGLHTTTQSKSTMKSYAPLIKSKRHKAKSAVALQTDVSHFSMFRVCWAIFNLCWWLVKFYTFFCSDLFWTLLYTACLI